MKRRKSKRGIYCSKCGTKLEDGWACGRDQSIFFWYCSTCDAFASWQVVRGTDVSEEGKESIKSFLRYAAGIAARQKRLGH